jgi:hypothetical protein
MAKPGVEFPTPWVLQCVIEVSEMDLTGMFITCIVEALEALCQGTLDSNGDGSAIAAASATHTLSITITLLFIFCCHFFAHTPYFNYRTISLADGGFPARLRVYL